MYNNDDCNRNEMMTVLISNAMVSALRASPVIDSMFHADSAGYTDDNVDYLGVAQDFITNRKALDGLTPLTKVMCIHAINLVLASHTSPVDYAMVLDISENLANALYDSEARTLFYNKLIHDIAEVMKTV